MTAPRVVLDTNVVVSALLFGNGHLAWCRIAWQTQRFVPLVNRATTQELLRVLAYPKFKLTHDERQQLLEDFLPWVETVAGAAEAHGLPHIADPDDRKFLVLAKAANADVLVSGDRHILDLRDSGFTVPIQTPAEFQRWLDEATDS